MRSSSLYKQSNIPIYFLLPQNSSWINVSSVFSAGGGAFLLPFLPAFTFHRFPGSTGFIRLLLTLNSLSSSVFLNICFIILVFWKYLKMHKFTFVFLTIYLCTVAICMSLRASKCVRAYAGCHSPGVIRAISITRVVRINAAFITGDTSV